MTLASSFSDELMLIRGCAFCGALPVNVSGGHADIRGLKNFFGAIVDLADGVNQMKPSIIEGESGSETLDDYQAHAIREIVRAVRSVAFGSIEIVIQNSRIVQIERKEKFRFDRG